MTNQLSRTFVYNKNKSNGIVYGITQDGYVIVDKTTMENIMRDMLDKYSGPLYDTRNKGMIDGAELRLGVAMKSKTTNGSDRILVLSASENYDELEKYWRDISRKVKQALEK